MYRDWRIVTSYRGCIGQGQGSNCHSDGSKSMQGVCILYRMSYCSFIDARLVCIKIGSTYVANIAEIHFHLYARKYSTLL